MPAVRVRYDAPPTVSRFLDSDAFVRVVVGPIGSGKSSGCVLEILRRAREQEPGPDGIRRTRFAIIRNTYSQLRDTTRKTFEQWIPPQLGTWHEQSFSFRMRFADVDCEVLFRALDRPQDVGKLLSLELTGCYFNELREIAKPIFDGIQGRVGRYPSKIQGGATWFGVWADTNPWHTGHWCHKLFKAKPEGFELYRQPGGLGPDAENTENLPPGYYERLCTGKDTVWIDVYVRGKEATSDVGSIFGALLDALEARGGLEAFEHPGDEVFTNWDLGLSDAAAIWLWRINAHGAADVIDFYADSGKPTSHYLDWLEKRARECGYTYLKHWLPHDARAKTMATGTSVLEQVTGRFGNSAVAIVPSLSLLDGLSAARWHLEQPVRIHPRCGEPILDASGGEQYPGGIEALREYRYAWDEEARCFSRHPLHNWASHAADGFRYLSIVVRFSDLMTRKPAPKPQRPAAVAPSEAYSLDELFAANQGPRSRGRI